MSTSKNEVRSYTDIAQHLIEVGCDPVGLHMNELFTLRNLAGISIYKALTTAYEIGVTQGYQRRCEEERRTDHERK